MSPHPVNDRRPACVLAFILNLTSAFTLFALMLITCIDVIGRYVFNHPLTGSAELTEMGLGILIFSAFPVISWRNEHIVVDMLDRFTAPIVHMLRSIVLNIITSIALYFLGDRIITLGQRSLSYGEESEFLAIPLGWTINFIGSMCWLAAVTLLTLGIYRTIEGYRLHKAPEEGTIFR